MKKIRFGIVGTGNIAHRFARAICNVEGAELAAVASRTSENAEKFGREFDIPYRFASYRDMACSDLIDVAYIAVPHSGHITASMLMMEHGKHVLCEKPIAVNEREAGQMFDCAQKHHVFLMEAMWSRFVPGTLKLIELAESGAIGEIRGVEGKFCYNMADEPCDRIFENAYGGGSLLDVGVYALYFANWYLGENVTEMYAVADLQNGIDTHLGLLLKYKNGAIADLGSAVLVEKPKTGFLYGTKGYIRTDRFYAPQQLEIHTDGGDAVTMNLPFLGNGFEEQIIHVCDCIRKGEIASPVITPQASISVMRQMDRIRSRIGLSYPQDAV